MNGLRLTDISSNNNLPPVPFKYENRDIALYIIKFYVKIKQTGFLFCFWYAQGISYVFNWLGAEKMPHGGWWEMSVITQAARTGIFKITTIEQKVCARFGISHMTVKAYGNGTFRVKEK